MKTLRKTEGAISIFLCIILLAMMLLAGVLVEGARIKSASTQIESSLDSSAKSVLANYNYLLKELYGIMALSSDEPELLKDELEYYLERTLMAFDDAEEFSIMDFFGTGRDSAGPILDLYDYSLEDLKIQPIYNLSEPEVLRAQILEYMKYRGPKQLAEGLLDKFMVFKDLKKQSDILSKKIDVDKGMSDIKKSQDKASDNILAANKFCTDTDMINHLNIASGYILNRIRCENKIKNKKDEIEQAQSQIDAHESRINELILESMKGLGGRYSAESEDDENDEDDEDDGGWWERTKGKLAELGAVNEILEIAELRGRIREMKKKISSLKTDIKQQEEEQKAKKNQINAIKTAMLNYINRFLDSAKKAESALVDVMNKSMGTVVMIDEINGDLKNETNEFADITRIDLGGKKERISTEDLTPKIEKVRFNIGILNDIKAYINDGRMDELCIDDFDGEIPDIDEIKEIIKIAQVSEKIDEYNGEKNDTPVDYYSDKGVISDSPEEGQGDPRDTMGDLIKDEGLEDEKEIKESDKKMPDDVPSQGGTIKTSIEDIKMDKEHIDSILKIIGSGDFGGYGTGGIGEGELPTANPKDASFSGDSTSFSKNILGMFSKIAGIFTGGLAKIRDEVYINEYIIGNFANYTSDMEKDLDLRGQPMKNRPVFFDSNNADVEYILWGSNNEAENVLAVKSQVMLIRITLNAISIYLDASKMNMTLEAATLVAGWTGFGVPIVQMLIVIAWASAESVFDMNILLKGESLPILKTKDTWITGLNGLVNLAKDRLIDEAKEQVKHVAGKAIDYTEEEIGDYLDKASKVVEDYVDSKVDILVDKAFVKIENPIKEGMHSAEEIFKDFGKQIGVKVDNQVSKILEEISDKAETLLTDCIGKMKNSPLGEYAPKDGILGDDYSDVLEEYKNMYFEEAIEHLTSLTSQGETVLGLKVEEASKKINSLIFNTIQNSKGKIKEEIKNNISFHKTELTKSFKETLRKTASVGKEEVNSFVDSFGNTKDTGAMKTNFKASLLSMKYADYLRLLLLASNREKKMKRVADLIQVNMRLALEDDSFKMSDCSTYMRVDSEVSVRNIFLPNTFIPSRLKTGDGKRIKFDTILYKGY